MTQCMFGVRKGFFVQKLIVLSKLVHIIQAHQLAGVSHIHHQSCAVQELDFKQEAANSTRCQRNLNSKKSRVKGQVVVPKIEDGMVNHRVLVMEYVEGIKVTDRSALLLGQGVLSAAVGGRKVVFQMEGRLVDHCCYGL